MISFKSLISTILSCLLIAGIMAKAEASCVICQDEIDSESEKECLCTTCTEATKDVAPLAKKLKSGAEEMLQHQALAPEATSTFINNAEIPYQGQAYFDQQLVTDLRNTIYAGYKAFSQLTKSETQLGADVTVRSVLAPGHLTTILGLLFAPGAHTQLDKEQLLMAAWGGTFLTAKTNPQFHDNKHSKAYHYAITLYFLCAMQKRTSEHFSTEFFNWLKKHLITICEEYNPPDDMEENPTSVKQVSKPEDHLGKKPLTEVYQLLSSHPVIEPKDLFQRIEQELKSNAAFIFTVKFKLTLQGQVLTEPVEDTMGILRFSHNQKQYCHLLLKSPMVIITIPYDKLQATLEKLPDFYILQGTYYSVLSI